MSKKKRKRGAEAWSNSGPEPPQDVAGSQETQITSASFKSNAETLKHTPPISTPSATDQIIGGTELQSSQPHTARADAPAEERFNFYLLRPRTSSSRRVLIPLTASDTLGDALRGCTVEEFPTIYYFPTTAPELHEAFMLDEDYRKEEGEQQREFEELMKDVDPEILKRLKDDGRSSKADEEVDSKKILDVLKQDLGGL